MIARIIFDKPEGATLEDVAHFIRSALTSMGGCLHPEDPMFHSLKLKEIIVHGQVFDAHDDE